MIHIPGMEEGRDKEEWLKFELNVVDVLPVEEWIK
jgi:hypothetical protein